MSRSAKFLFCWIAASLNAYGGECATQPCQSAKKLGNLPIDVDRFVERRDGCDHFRGEPTDFDESYLKEMGDEAYKEQAARKSFVEEQIEELCRGSDAELAELKARYKGNSKIAELLRSYESRIE